MTDDVAPVLGPIGTLLEQAYGYAGLGLDIFPVNPRDKTPLTSQLHATTDLDTVEAWWRQWPDALIGHRISELHLILDIDPRHGGKETWNALKDEMGDFITRVHYSGRGDGGGHVWFQRPGDKVTITKLDAWAKERGVGHQVKDRWVCGIDILRHEHRYTIMPPSHHPETGRPYYWGKGRGLNIEPAPMPQLLVDLIVRDEPAAPVRPPTRLRDVDSIADWYSDQASWRTLLGAHGWVLVGGDGESDGSRWRHPEASNPLSATIKHGCLFVFSPNTPFEVTYPEEPHGYTPFRAYAVLEHAGDLSAAGREARGLRRPEAPEAPVAGPRAPTNGSKPMDRELALTPASAVRLQRVRWCWDGRLALGTLGLLAGPEGLGKSTVAFTMAAELTNGRLPGEYEGRATPVLVCATEDSWNHTIAPRFLAAGADMDLVYKIDMRVGTDLLTAISLPHDLEALEEGAKSVGAGLLILDPLISRLDVKLDSHKDGEVRQALEPLVSVAEATNMAILGLIHHNKSGSTNPLDAIMASKAFAAVARSVHTVIKDPDDETGLRRYFGTPKNNLGSTSLPTMSFTIEPFLYPTEDGEGSTGKVVWGPEVRESIADLLHRGSLGPEQRTAQREAEEWLDDYLSARDGQALAAEAKRAGKAAGHAVRTIERAMEHLKIESRRLAFQGPYWWLLPTSPTSPTDSPSQNVGEVGELALDLPSSSPQLPTSPKESLPTREGELAVDPETQPVDGHLYAPDGAPSCRFGRGLACLNGDACLSPNHREPA